MFKRVAARDPGPIPAPATPGFLALTVEGDADKAVRFLIARI